MNENSPQSIPLQPIPDMQSLEAALALRVNGLIGERRSAGALDGRLLVDGPRSKITVSGDLLGEIAAQVGGAVVGLFTPQSVDFYKMPDGPYVAVNGLMPICVRPRSPQAQALVAELSPESLLGMLAAPEVARGRYLGEETVHGRRLRHYLVDGPAFLAAARASSDPRLRAFGEGLWAAADADLYVDAAGGYPVALNGRYRGSFAPLRFTGDFSLDVALTAMGQGTAVTLPPACDQPINM